MAPHPLARIRRGRMGYGEILNFIRENRFLAVVDATHPYAKQATENIRAAARQAGLPYVRLERDACAREESASAREGNAYTQEENACALEENTCALEENAYMREENASARERPVPLIRYFTDIPSCAKALGHVRGNILLTTGCKGLAEFCAAGDLADRLYVRTLPSVESLAACGEQGIFGKRVVAMQGPFTVEMNLALIRQFGISCLVTKESGNAGGYPEKIEAARQAGIPVFVIGRGQAEPGYSFPDALRKIEEICALPPGALSERSNLEIALVGAGMGGEGCLTGDALREIEGADALFGAERLISPWEPRLMKKPFYEARRILPCLRELQSMGGGQKIRVAVLFSGDSGFYSGCRALSDALREEIGAGRLEASVKILPGISSISYLASCVGESYEDAAICSLHGKDVPGLAGTIRQSEKTFLLTSGPADVVRLGELLLREDLAFCEVTAGYRLSYPNQEILRLRPEECCQVRKKGLYACLVKNPRVSPPSPAEKEAWRAAEPMPGVGMPEGALLGAEEAWKAAEPMSGVGLLEGPFSAAKEAWKAAEPMPVAGFPEGPFSVTEEPEGPFSGAEEAGEASPPAPGAKRELPARGQLTHGRPDLDFLRGKAPMTKEEVREVCVCKLRLHKDAVVYDIGSGTGSVAAEIAGVSDSIRVYAIERREEAVSLILRNREKLGLPNLSVVLGEAPEALAGLPRPTHAFIGGSGGRLREILSALYGKNPGMRVVMTAVSLETVAQIREIREAYPAARIEFLQMQVSRAKEAGEHHLMLAENPVFICAFDFGGRREEDAKDHGSRHQEREREDAGQLRPDAGPKGERAEGGAL